MIDSAPVMNEANWRQAPQLDRLPRLLLGPSPSHAHPRVLNATGMCRDGPFDPTFFQLAEAIQTMLCDPWQTDHPLTVPVHGTRSATGDATRVNLVEPGDVGPASKGVVAPVW